MRSRTLLGLAFAVCLALAMAVAAPLARAAGNCTAVAGTILGHYDFDGPEGPAWYGWAYLTFGKDPTVWSARLVDLNDGYRANPYKANFAGYEILTYTIDGVGSFQTNSHFLCTAGATPNFCGFSEEGAVDPEAGTGLFEGMSGSIASRGEAGWGSDPAGPTPDQPWLWIAQLTGTLCKK